MIIIFAILYVLYEIFKKIYKTKLKIKIVRITLQILNINCILYMIVSLNKYNPTLFRIPK